MDDEITVILVIAALVFCVVSLVIGLVKWSSNPVSNTFSFSGVLGSWSFNDNKDIVTNGSTDGTNNSGVYSYGLYSDFKANDLYKIGTFISGKTSDQCRVLCSATETCRGFSTDNNGCQLYNNVLILDRNKGSSVYASQDIGAAEYFHVPFGVYSSSLTTLKETVNGTLAESLGECHGARSSSSPCKGFDFNGTSGNLYNSIIALDSTVSGNSYIDIDNPPKFITEGNFKYQDTPTSTNTLDAMFIMPSNFNPVTNLDKFGIWGTGWDVANDNQGQLSSITTPPGAESCANACASNSWCQSFVVGKEGDSGLCWQRHDLSRDHTHQVCSSQTFGCSPEAISLGLSHYNTVNYSTPSSTRDSYFKYQYPMKLSCPMACSNDSDCKMVTFNSTSCNMYNVNPTNKVGDSSYSSVWMFNNYPR